MTVSWRRWSRILPVVVLLGLGLAVRAVPDPLLRTVGSVLVVDEPIGPADAIVVPQWAGGAGAIDASDLVHSGIARRVVVLPEPPKPSEGELARRGISYQDEAADLIELLRRLGVTDVDRIPTPAGGTEAEGRVLSSWCEQHQLRSVILVSSPDHSRRTRRVLHRSLNGHTTKVVIRSARYSTFDPDRWWETRENIRTAIVELQKLLLDIVHHPIS
jgi:hypothetical protein